MRLIPTANQVPPHVKLLRWNMCSNCEHKRVLGKMIQCKKCGCIMNAKSGLKKASCPINKWGPYTQ